jgi:hypothetical protein
MPRKPVATPRAGRTLGHDVQRRRLDIVTRSDYVPSQAMLLGFTDMEPLAAIEATYTHTGCDSHA